LLVNVMEQRNGEKMRLRVKWLGAQFIPESETSRNYDDDVVPARFSVWPRVKRLVSTSQSIDKPLGYRPLNRFPFW
jgi:hypothetical protein